MSRHTPLATLPEARQRDTCSPGQKPDGPTVPQSRVLVGTLIILRREQTCRQLRTAVPAHRPRGGETTPLTPAASRCRILAASTRPRPSCSHTGHVLTSFSRTLKSRRGRQFFRVPGRPGPTPSSSSSSCLSPLPTSGIGLRTE